MCEIERKIGTIQNTNGKRKHKYINKSEQEWAIKSEIVWGVGGEILGHQLYGYDEDMDW